MRPWGARWRPRIGVSATDRLQFAREVLEAEAAAVGRMTAALGDGFDCAVQLCLDCAGAVVCSGVGKAGHIARKVSATLASVGTPSHFLNPADAVHGDLGSIRKGDVLLLFSASGESDELVRLLGIVKRLEHPVIAVTASAGSSLGRHADAVIPMGRLAEACHIRMAPSCSTTAMLALGDALALTVSRERNFTADDFALFHPAGQLGRKLMTVAEAMTFRTGTNLPLATSEMTVAEAIHEAAKITRRPGAICVVDDGGTLLGIFSDGDLRRLLDRRPAEALGLRMADVMTANPKRIQADDLAAEAMAVMRKHRIDELPVVDGTGKCVGLIDVQDLVVLRLFEIDPAEGDKGKDA